MSGDNSVRQSLADLADVRVNLRHVRPVDRTFKRVGRNAEVHERVSEIRVVKASLFPALADEGGKAHCAVFLCNAADILRNICRISLFTVGKAEEKAALHVLEACYVKQLPKRSFVNII